MNHFTSPEFWEFFHQLPVEVQELARANYELLESNPHHPSLHFKKVGDYTTGPLTAATSYSAEPLSECGTVTSNAVEISVGGTRSRAARH